MTAYGFFTNHQLPMAGGYLNQANKVIEAIGLLQHLSNKSQDEATKKQDKNKRKPYGLQGKTSTDKSKPAQTFKKGRPAPTPKASVSRMKKK